MTFEDFITEFDVLKDRGYNRNTFKVTNIEHASFIEKLRHWAYCKDTNIECEFDLSFLNNESLQRKIDEMYKESKSKGGIFLSFLYNNLYKFEECFSQSEDERTNRWNLFETASDSELNDLRNQLKEKDKIIQEMEEKLNAKEDEHLIDGLETLMRGILNDF